MWFPPEQWNRASQLLQVRMSQIGLPVKLCPVCLHCTGGKVLVLVGRRDPIVAVLRVDFSRDLVSGSTGARGRWFPFGRFSSGPATRILLLFSAPTLSPFLYRSLVRGVLLFFLDRYVNTLKWCPVQPPRPCNPSIGRPDCLGGVVADQI